MPARVIRSEINSSQSLSRVSLMADHFFRALLLECDDFGRFDGRPPILKAALFPLREEYTPEAIEACVEELVSGDRPPLRVFHVDGRPYLALTGWEKHRGKGKRAERSKYPDPPQESAPRKRSPRIPADPRGSDRGSARLTSDVLRLTSDDARGTIQEHSHSKTRVSDGACAPSPAPDAPERWVSILGQEPGSAEEKLAFVTRELPLAVAEAEEHHPRDRKAQRGKIRSVLIRHYRWQRTHPTPSAARQRERPQTFHEISVANTMQAAQDALPLVLARQEEIERGERRRLKG